MATTGEEAHDSTAGDTAEKLADMASEAAAKAAEAAGDILGEDGSGGSNAWSFWFRALMGILVVAAFFVATRVIRAETPDERRLRLRAERRAKKKADQDGPDEIDRLLNSVVRRQPGAPVPPNAVPIGGRGMPRGVPPGGAGGRGPGAAAAAARMAAARGNGAGRGPPPPPPGGDNRPKLRWDQSNEEVEIIIRVDPKVARAHVKVDVTSTMLKLSLRGQTVIAGHLFKPVDPEGCTWQIDDPGPGHPKEVTITLLKAEPSTSRENWWRAPLKGLENRGPPPRRPSQPADPEMVRKAIEAIKAKSAAGGGVKPMGKPGVKPPAADGSPMAAASSSSSAVGGALPSAAASTGADATGDGPGDGAGAAKPSSGKAVKGSGKKKNRKKK